MPKAAPVQNKVLNAPYSPIGRMKSDGFTIPHLNSSPTLAIYPNEPFLKNQGSEKIVVLAQSLILPGEVKSVVRQWNAIFPCNFSANVKDGDEVYWDISAEKCVLEGDAAVGDFLLGTATFSLEPGTTATAADNDRPVVATSASTEVQVVCLSTATTVKAS